jgi:hypothetical protein
VRLFVRQQQQVVDRELKPVACQDYFCAARLFVAFDVVRRHQVDVSFLVLGDILPQIVDPRPRGSFNLEKTLHDWDFCKQLWPAKVGFITIGVEELKRNQ